MTIALTRDQQDLAEVVARFTDRHAPIAATRAAFAGLAAGAVQPSWQALVGQRLHAIHLPEWAGGDGAGLVELAVVLEQAAFGLFPGPLLPTVGWYSPIGSESAPIIQFYDSLGYHQLAERSIQFFLDRQHDDGFIQTFGGYQLETGPLLWSVGDLKNDSSVVSLKNSGPPQLIDTTPTPR